MSSEFSSTWWSQKWIDSLDAMGWSNRLQRGQSYARNGRVLAVEVHSGLALAKVRGSRSRPYTIKIQLETLTETQWAQVIEQMAGQLHWAAELLAGQMPETIQEAFAASKAHLLPSSHKDLTQDCSCPDWANPCKHIAAAHYVLAESLDDDPFLMFALRGKTAAALLGELRERWGQQKKKTKKAKVKTPKLSETNYWGRDIPDTFDVGLQNSESGHSLMTRLGPPHRKIPLEAWLKVTDQLYLRGQKLAQSLTSSSWENRERWEEDS